MNLKNKKILVTGAGGFIGSHLTETLVKRGYDVRAFVHYNSFNSYGWLDSFIPNAAVEGEQPTAQCTIIPSNQNASGTETAPVYTAA